MIKIRADGLQIHVVGIGLLATALHWLITPAAHPQASAALVAGAWGQVLAGGVLAFIGHRRDRAQRQALGASYPPLASAGLTALAGAFLAGTGGHWLITPAAHPSASTLLFVGVWVQITVGAVLIYRAGQCATRATAT